MDSRALISYTLNKAICLVWTVEPVLYAVLLRKGYRRDIDAVSPLNSHLEIAGSEACENWLTRTRLS